MSIKCLAISILLMIDTLIETLTELFDCACGECVSLCMSISGFDYETDTGMIGEGIPQIDWNVNGTVVPGAPIAGTVNKGEWYQSLVDYINASVPDWSAAITADVPVSDSSRPTFEFTYTGSAFPATLTLTRLSGTSDILTITATDDANLDVRWEDGGNAIGSPSMATCGDNTVTDISGT